MLVRLAYLASAVAADESVSLLQRDRVSLSIDSHGTVMDLDLDEDQKDEDGALMVKSSKIPKLPCGLTHILGDAARKEVSDEAETGAVCSAFAPTYNGDCSSFSLHYDQWYQKDGKNGYYQIEYTAPQPVTKFTANIGRGPAYKIKYSDDGEDWQEVFDKPTHTSGQHSASWSRDAGSHKMWRYEISGDWSGGPWYTNLKFHVDVPCDEEMLASCAFTKMLPSLSCEESTGTCYSKFDEFTGGECSSHATVNVPDGYCMDSGLDGSSPRGMQSKLHFDGQANAQWDLDMLYYQIDAGTPQPFGAFSMGFTNAPTVKILYSDVGSLDSCNWTEAGRSHNYAQKAAATSPVQYNFPFSGSHRFWRAQLTGEYYKSGYWYNMMLWYNIDKKDGVSQCSPDIQPPCTWLSLVDGGWEPVDLTGSSCNAHAYSYDDYGDGCPTIARKLKWNRWVDFRGRIGYFEITISEPRKVASASFYTDAAIPLNFSVYGVDDDGPQLVSRAPLTTKDIGVSQKFHMRWPVGGRFKTWRFQVVDNGKALGGGYWKFELKAPAVRECTYTPIARTTSTTTRTDMVPYAPTRVLPTCPQPPGWNLTTKMELDSYEQCQCTAPYCCKAEGPEVCKDSCYVHFDQWWQQDGTPGKHTSMFKSPVGLTRFSLSCGRSPAFKIRYSDDGETFEDAAPSFPSQANPNVTWDYAGEHQYWRYELDGDWAGGPWYTKFAWYKPISRPSCDVAPQQLCDSPYAMVFSTATNNLDDATDPYLRYEKVFARNGQYIDLLIVPVAGSVWSGKKDVPVIKGQVGVLNLEGIDDAKFEVDIQFVLHQTRTTVKVDNFLFSVLDIDRAKSGKCKKGLLPCSTQSLLASGFDKYYLADEPNLDVSPVGDATLFTATGLSGGENNPDSYTVSELTDVQSKCAVTFRYTNVNKIRMTFKVTKGSGRQWRNFMFGGSASIACPPGTTTTTTTPNLPTTCYGKNLECPADWKSKVAGWVANSNGNVCYESCSSWRDPHFTRTFYANYAEGGFNAYNEGLFDLVVLKDNSLHVQGFLCDSGGGTTSYLGFAMRIGTNRISWVRKANTTVPDCPTGITCVPEGMVAKEAWDMKLNGQEVQFDQLPLWTNANDYIIKEPSMWATGLAGDSSIADGEPMCIGDGEKKRFKIQTGIQVKSPNNQMLPTMHIEVAKGAARAVGLCGSTADRVPLSSEKSIFKTTELAQLCDVCGMNTDSGGHCKPPTKFHKSNTPQAVCAKAGIDYSDAVSKCNDALGAVENKEVWVASCVAEFCVSGGDENEIKNAAEESNIEAVADGR